MNSVTHQGANYDLVVIGSGPAGQAAALEAAALGKRVAIVECSPQVGGGAVRSGVLPSTTFRAAVIGATSAAQRHARRIYRGDGEVTLDDLLWRMNGVLDRERQSVRDQLRRARVDIVSGHASFVDRHTVDLDRPGRRSTLRADLFVIAVGARMVAPPGVSFDDRTVLDAERILTIREIPRTLTVVGAGVSGIEYASIFAALGTRVTVVERHTTILDEADEQIADTLLYHLRGIGIAFHLGQAVASVSPGAGRATCRLADGTAIASDIVLVTAGRAGATEAMGLDALGIQTDQRGHIVVDHEYRTACDGVFAAGDVLGSPPLDTSAQEQGRGAARVACGVPVRRCPAPAPTGIFTIPEISFVGHCERDLAEAGVPYARGLSHYRELIRGEIAGDRVGLLKLLVHRDTRRLLGVHIFGTAAAELVHIGQTVMAAGLPVDYLVGAAYADPTFADAYRIAAADAVQRIAAIGETPAEAA